MAKFIARYRTASITYFRHINRWYRFFAATIVSVQKVEVAMKIALVGAEFEENLSVRYIWGALRQQGHEVVFITFNSAAEIDDAAKKLAESAAPLAGFSMVFTARAREFTAVARRARELGYAGHIIAGGHFAAFNAEALLNDVPEIDSVAIGEGENIMCGLAQYAGDGSRVNGIFWRTQLGEIAHNPPAENPQNLDALAQPVRKWPPDRFLGLPIVNILASRGCTHACNFCSISAWHRMCGGARHRIRAVECVADEMAGLYFDGVRIFNFHDDNFLFRDKRATLARLAALKTELDERGVGRIAFAIKARPDEVHRDVFEALVSMGLFRVFLGIEAGTAESLRNLGRGQTLEQNKAALAVMNDLGIHACFNLLFLNPDSTLEDFAANVAFLREHPRNPMNFCRTEIYAGTPLEQKMSATGRLRGDYWGHDYTIADPRAEAAFHLVHESFHERCRGIDALHHLVMAVDYEHQLFAHFYRRDGSRRRRVKDFIIAVNMNSGAYLEEIAAKCRDDFSAVDRETFLDDLRRRLDRDTAELRQRGWELSAEIREAATHAQSEARTGRIGKTALATGLAVAAALDAACVPYHTEMAPDSQIVKPVKPVDHPQYCEPAPPPLRTNESPRMDLPYPEMAPEAQVIKTTKPDFQTQVCDPAPQPLEVRTFHTEMAPVPLKTRNSDNSGTFATEEAPPAMIVTNIASSGTAARVGRIVLQELSPLVKPQSVTVVLWFNSTGKPVKAIVSGESLAAKEKKFAERVIGFNAIDIPAAFGKHFRFEFTRGDFTK